MNNNQQTLKCPHCDKTYGSQSTFARYMPRHLEKFHLVQLDKKSKTGSQLEDMYDDQQAHVQLVSGGLTHTLLDESLRENELIDLKKISGGIYRTMTDEKHMESNILSVEKQIEKELNKYIVAKTATKTFWEQSGDYTCLNIEPEDFFRLTAGQDARRGSWTSHQDIHSSCQMVDFDIFQHTSDRLITQDHLEQFIRAFFVRAKQFYKISDDHDITVISTMKPSVVWKESKGMYKDGVHLYIYFKSSRTAKRLMLNALAGDMEEIFSETFPDTWHEILDMQCAHVPPLVYGSAKSGSDPYVAECMWDVCDGEPEEVQIPVSYLPNLAHEMYINEEATHIKKPHFDLKPQYIVESKPYIKSNTVSDDECAEKVSSLIGCLPDDIADLYEDYTKGIWAIAGIADRENTDLIDVAYEFTHKSSDPDEIFTDKLYSKARAQGKTYGWKTLRDWVEAVNPSGFATWKARYDGEFKLAEMLKTQEAFDSYVQVESKVDICWDFDTVVPIQSNEPKYFSDLEQVCKTKNMPFKQALEWWNGCVKYIKNGGDSYFITLDIHDESIIKDDGSVLVESVSKIYKTIKQTTMERYVNGHICNIQNPEFDLERYSKQAEMLSMGAKIPANKQYKGSQHFTRMTSGPPGSLRFYDKIKSEWMFESYNQVDFVPYLSRKPALRDKINLFNGFPLHASTCNIQVDRSKPHPFESTKLYKHIREGICDEDPKAFEFLIKWFADMVQNPAILPITMILLIGEQGTGKSLMYLFGKVLTGSHHAISYGDIDRFFKSFNSIKANKLFIGLEELADRGTAHKEKHNQFKYEVASPTQQIEPKGIDPFTIKHSTRYIGFTNNNLPLYIENKGRRNFILKVRSDNANNPAYFDPLFAELENPKIRKMLFHYMAFHVDLTGFKVKNPPETSTKNHMKIVCMSNVYKFIAHLVSDKDNVKLLETELYGEYVQWVDSQRLKSVSCPTFVDLLKEIKFRKKTIWYGGSSRWGYEISKDAYISNMKNWFKMDSFSLEAVLG
jgi:hypothetical protein